MRRENSIDFWRGYALVCIFVNHIPGMRLEHFTLRAFSIADSAEMFVFFAGYAVHLTGKRTNVTGTDLLRQFASRAFDIYRAHLVSVCCCIILLTQCAHYLRQPEILQWMRLPELIERPFNGMLGIVLMSFQLQYFDILPLYVLLLLASPLMIAMARRSLPATLALSFSVYAAVSLTRFNLHQWPGTDDWFFNPLAWQFAFVLGYCCASKPWQNLPLGKVRTPLRLASAGVVLAAVCMHLVKLAPDPVSAEASLLAYLFNKTFLGPARLIDFLALVFVFRKSFTYLAFLTPALTAAGCLLGRNSLAVFCTGSMLSVLGQVARLETGGPLIVDLAVCAFGVTILFLTAKAAEWQKLKQRVSSSAEPYGLRG